MSEREQQFLIPRSDRLLPANIPMSELPISPEETDTTSPKVTESSTVQITDTVSPNQVIPQIEAFHSEKTRVSIQDSADETQVRILPVDGSHTIARVTIMVPLEEAEAIVEVEVADLNERRFRFRGGLNVGKGVRILNMLVKAQEKAFTIMGRSEKDRMGAVYNKAIADFNHLCQEAGVSVPFYLRSEERGRWSEELLNQKETYFLSTFTAPLDEIEKHFNGDRKADYARFVESLGLEDSANSYQEDVLRAIMKHNDLQSCLKDNGFNESVIKNIQDNITRAKLLALSLYDKYHWREFVERLMSQEATPRDRNAARFDAEAGIRFTEPSQVESGVRFATRVMRAIEEVMSAGVEYTFKRRIVKQTNGDTSIEESQVPVFVPLSYAYRTNSNGQREMKPVHQPGIMGEYIKYQSGEPNDSVLLNNSRKFQVNLSPSAAVQIIEIDEPAPQSTHDYANLAETLSARHEMNQRNVPMSWRIVKYSDGMFITAISDHMVTDGVPLANELVSTVVDKLKLGEPIPAIRPDLREAHMERAAFLAGLVPEEQALSEPFTELTAPVPLRALARFRQMIKAAARKNALIDSQGKEVSDQGLGLGSMISLVYGHQLNDLAMQEGYLHKPGRGNIGGLSAQKELSEQLMQVSLSELKLPLTVKDWFLFEEGKVVLTDAFLDVMNLAQITFNQQDNPRESTSTVRSVHFLPEMLWGLNSWASSTILRPLATHEVGSVMVSALNTRNQVLGGPALVEKWQELAVTFSVADLDRGYLMGKFKYAHEQSKARELVQRYIEKLYEWEKTHGANQEIRKALEYFNS